MSASEIPKATVTDKLLVIPILAKAIFAAISRLVTYPLTSTPKANTLFKDVAFAALRANLGSISIAQEQWYNPTTESVWLEFAKKKHIDPEVTTLSSGAKVAWLGPKTAEKVLLYFHGGGYVLSASSGHLEWMYDLQKDLSKDRSVALVIVAYTLAPHAQYPTQVRQAAESLEWLISSQKKTPSNIFIGGDSAGGNLTLALMSHLIHPHPEVSNKIQLSEPLAGAILISPWVDFSTEQDSVKRNLTSDMLSPAAAKRWSSLFLGKSSLDNYNQPILADSRWFSGLDLCVNDILVWGGGGEVLIDSIRVIAKMLKDAHPRTEYVEQANAAHEDFIMDRLLGYTTKGEGTKLVESWVTERL